MKCFEYFLDQHEKWSTPSIGFQFNSDKTNSSKNNIPEVDEALSNPCDDDMAAENEEIAAAEDNGDEEEEEKVGDTVAAVAIKQSLDSETDEQVRKNW